MIRRLFVVLLVMCAGWSQPAGACTGITLVSKDGARVLARTIEWGGSNLNSRYVVVPRGYTQPILLPGGKQGTLFTAQYGYVGFAVEQEIFVAEGMNEAGLSAGLFYFPGYGQYPEYDPQQKSTTVADLQLVAWILGRCRTVEEVEAAVRELRVVSIDPRASTVHWRFADVSGRQVVLEIINGQPRFYENKLGVLTNSPGFDWQMTNLNNYVNLRSGSTTAQWLGHDTELVPFGAGSGFLGIPGDVTPPSRFVRAAFYQSSAPRQDSALQTVLQCFRILGSFEIPIGIEFSAGEPPTDIPSATQWTSAADLMNRKIYYNTMYNSAIRCIDLRQIDFSRVKYRSVPLDETKHQSVETLTIR